jgi:hypothetical protein
MDLNCPTCQKPLHVPSDFIGQRTNCPACGGSVRVTKPPIDDDLVIETADIWIDDDIDEDVAVEVVVDQAPTTTCPMCAETVNRSANTCPYCGEPLVGLRGLAGSRKHSDQAQTKTCPICAETVAASAKTCRYCGEPLAELPDLHARSKHGVWRDGYQLVMHKQSQLPFICVKTNEPADDWLRCKLYWHPDVIYLSILFGFVPYLIVALAVRSRADVEIGLCRKQIVRRRRRLGWAWPLILISCSLVTAGVVYSRHRGEIGGLAMFLGMISFIVGGILMISARLVRAARITDQYVWIKGVNPAFLARLPPFPGEL